MDISTSSVEISKYKWSPHMRADAPKYKLNSNLITQRQIGLKSTKRMTIYKDQIIISTAVYRNKYFKKLPTG
jgi:hypothetical protein